ncbi:Flavin monooxygenase-like protein [Metarhizium album ARSEF 1941]|uniref:Flavin monooxygenase-like protein n=1 Tax=Metarhizium album (strain ARSEF 1941) TaxID=1081103 RepID=A0A0B2WYT7_METAS|nr:Flavin monooxygenase-like protein [Metarhizium album ARSEF 1941]KHN98020.1 Flavin monooxygenase-like protein [Metarhizium album ARSEF 1941]
MPSPPTNDARHLPGGDASARRTSPAARGISIRDEPAFTPRRLRVVCVGAGYSGLMIAYKYKYEARSDSFVDLTIYEKNGDVGGTWLENRYPGVACDVPAHIYTFSFEPNPDWSSFYAGGAEIWQYIKRTTEKYHLDEKVQFNCTVTSSTWDDEAGKWRLRVRKGDQTIEDEADVLINGSGLLNKWKWPAIQGLHSFRGTLLHSASWDASFDWTGKRVGIIGNGSSGIQILPRMQPGAGKIVHYIRSPTWISSPFLAAMAPEAGRFSYSDEDRARFRRDPQELLRLRKTMEHGFNQAFYANLLGTPQEAASGRAFEASMRRRLNDDPELCEKLIPTWKAGCRRLTPGEGYLEALQRPNVALEFAAISGVTETGVHTEGGGFQELDAIVCATGFDVGFVPSWDVVGKKGVRLADQWEEEPTAYLSICAPNMPNYFVFNGPNAPVGHGSLLSVMEWTAEYILRWCRKMATQGIKSVTVDSVATQEYNAYTQEFLKRTVWASGCRSWYKNNRRDGIITAMYAGSILHYKELLESFRTEDFHFEYRGANRFAFMGNGLTSLERDGGDLAFYVDK